MTADKRVNRLIVIVMSLIGCIYLFSFLGSQIKGSLVISIPILVIVVMATGFCIYQFPKFRTWLQMKSGQFWEWLKFGFVPASNPTKKRRKKRG